jgi:hypothetical protein
MNPVDLSILRDTLLLALREDIGTGDLTSRATISPNARATAQYTTKQELVVAGIFRRAGDRSASSIQLCNSRFSPPTPVPFSSGTALANCSWSGSVHSDGGAHLSQLPSTACVVLPL